MPKMQEMTNKLDLKRLADALGGTRYPLAGLVHAPRRGAADFEECAAKLAGVLCLPFETTAERLARYSRTRLTGHWGCYSAILRGDEEAWAFMLALPPCPYCHRNDRLSMALSEPGYARCSRCRAGFDISYWRAHA